VDRGTEGVRNRLRSLTRCAPLDAIARDVEDLLSHGAVQSSHLRYFGLFNPTVHAAGVVADAIAALYNPQLGGWWHAPAAAEIERAALAWFVRRAGLDPDDATAMFTSGGSEANHMAVLVALTRRYPEFAEAGARGAPAAPVFYASDQAHDSLASTRRGAVRRC
jgi:aromatic-L-amino-acid/L-tryptophan decarboxylase